MSFWLKEIMGNYRNMLKKQYDLFGITYQVSDSQTFIALFQQFQKEEKKSFLHILCFEYKGLFV